MSAGGSAPPLIGVGVSGAKLAHRAAVIDSAVTGPAPVELVAEVTPVALEDVGEPDDVLPPEPSSTLSSPHPRTKSVAPRGPSKIERRMR
jgi:hypothetical protein